VVVTKKGIWFGVLLVMLVWVLPGVALADGPSGSSECALADDDCDGVIDEADGTDPPGDATDEGENQTNCNESSSTSTAGVAYVYGGTNGAEVCADEGSAFPVDGRVIVDAEEGYVAIDGDNSNPAPANGYARVDDGGVHCGDEQNQDSTSTDQSGNTSADCG
jgi:hypothetical protein